MLASFANNAISTKVRCMYGRRITPEQFRELARSKSIADIAKFLKEETDYREILSDVQPSMLHRGQLEKLLRYDRFSRYLRLMRYNQDPNNEFYSYIIVEIELRQILQMIRLLNSNRPGEYATKFPSYIGEHSSYDFMKMATITSFDELLIVLQATPYKELLLPFKPSGEESIDFTGCETALFTYYFDSLSKSIDKKFSKQIARQLHDIMDSRVELLNISKIYRTKRYYPDTSPDYLKSCLLPFTYRITPAQFAKLVDAQDDKQVMKLLGETSFGKHFDSDAFTFIEYSAESIRYHLNKRYLHRYCDAPTAFAAYMVLNAIEISNITNVIEGVQYNVPAGEIESLLIL